MIEKQQRTVISGDSGLSIFLSGRDVWNNYVSDNPNSDVDFSDVDFPLSEGNASGAGHDFSWYHFPENGSVCFQGAKFGDEPVSFKGAQFGSGSVDFSEVEFGRGLVDFSEVTFGKENVYFDKTNFGDGNVSFSKAKFEGENIDFSRASFRNGNVTFRKANFGIAHLCFVNVRFTHGAFSFEEARFGPGGVDFSGTHFDSCIVNFDSSKFYLGNAFFRNTVFGPGNVSFYQAVFTGKTVDFTGAKFVKGEIDFSKVSFSDGFVSFNKVEFCEGDVLFCNTKFGQGGVSYNRVKFGGGSVDFRDANFGENEVDFSYIEASGHVTFHRLKRPSLIKGFSLRHSVFGKSLDLSGNTFACIPDLTNTKLTSQLSLDRLYCAFREEGGEMDPLDGDRLCRLKELSEGNKNHTQALAFHAQEMRVKRANLKFTSRLLDYSFDLVARYGRSISIPCNYLLLVTVFYALIYLQIGITRLQPDTLLEKIYLVSNGVLYSLVQILPFLSSGRVAAVVSGKALFGSESMTFLIHAVSVSQGVISFVLLFLVGLGIRNRFRL